MSIFLENKSLSESSTQTHLPTGFGTQEFKQEIRKKISNSLNGRIYAFLILTFLFSIVILLAKSISNFQFYQIYLAIFYFLFCNFFEYLLHRFLMHKKIKGLEFVYEHVSVHHNFFTDELYYFEEPSDFYAVLLPFYVLIGFTFPVIIGAFLIYLVFNMNNALIFALVMYGYYLMYELLHFSYHAKKESFIKKFSIIRFLSQNHLLHHQTTLMTNYNFNITFPIFDIIFKTFFTKNNRNFIKTQISTKA